MNALRPLTHSILLFLALHATCAKSIRPEGFKPGIPLGPLGAKMETGVGLQEIEGPASGPFVHAAELGGEPVSIRLERTVRPG